MTTLVQIATNQYQPGATANELFEAVAPSGTFGPKHTTTTGLTLGIYGGIWPLNGAFVTKADGTLSLTGSATNYVEIDAFGTVSKNTTGFTAGSLPLFTVSTNTTSITGISDYRPWARPMMPHTLVKTWPSDANYTLTGLESTATVIFLTGGALSQTRSLLIPPNWCGWIRNGTSGSPSQSVKVIENGSPQGAGITIANGSGAWIFGDGTNIYRGSADSP